MDEFTPYLQRYRRGEWRAPIFRDLILSDARKMRPSGGGVFLDIGCGCGFDNDPKLQAQIASESGQYIGIEPDKNIRLGDFFTTTYRCRFEDAPISPGSIDIGFAVMVLEHFPDPGAFWVKIHDVLRPGGVFWGFTADARHVLVRASLITERLRIKDLYLDAIHGRRGQGRYENYPVYYKSNTPAQIERLTKDFRVRSVLNFKRIGEFNYYLPKKAGWLGRNYDRLAMLMGCPGSVLAVRVEK